VRNPGSTMSALQKILVNSGFVGSRDSSLRQPCARNDGICVRRFDFFTNSERSESGSEVEGSRPVLGRLSEAAQRAPMDRQGRLSHWKKEAARDPSLRRPPLRMTTLICSQTLSGARCARRAKSRLRMPYRPETKSFGAHPFDRSLINDISSRYVWEIIVRCLEAIIGDGRWSRRSPYQGYWSSSE